MRTRPELTPEQERQIGSLIEVTDTLNRLRDRQAELIADLLDSGVSQRHLASALGTDPRPSVGGLARLSPKQIATIHERIKSEARSRPWNEAAR